MFGISTPTRDVPGIGAITLTLSASITLAISSESWTNLFTLTPSEGSISNKVIIGPVFMDPVLPSTPNVDMEVLKNSALSFK